MNFEYLRASNLTEAVGLLKKFEGKARIFAGGTELLVNMKHQALSPRYLIDIKSIPGLSYIRYETDGALSLGALTTVQDIESSPEIRERHAILVEAAQAIATLQIKNMGTLGGNLLQTVKCPYYNQSHVNLFMRQSISPCRQRGGNVCHAAQADTLNHAVIGKPARGCWAPTASDLATPLTALGASVIVVGQEGERDIPVERLFEGGGKTALKTGEILTAVKIPPLSREAKSRYQKYAQDIRNFSILNAAGILWLTPSGVLQDLRIVIGGLAVIPLRLLSLENKLKGQKLSSLFLDEIIQEEWAGARVLGELTHYKLEKARVMIIDLLEYLAG